MIPNLHPNTSYAVHLRASSVSGGKDWVGSVASNNEIHTYWGRTGQISQHAAKPGDMSALNKIIDSKKHGKDSYSPVDEFTPQHGWLSQKKETPVQPQPKVKPAAPAVDWIEAPNESINWDF